MENCNYGRSEMLVFNMVRQGLFGEVLHAEGGYLHDLREIKFANAGEGLWRRAWASKMNGNLYPTHGLGPVANCMDINRGDRFDYLVSMSGPSRGLQDWAREHFPDGSPQRAEKFVLGDVNVSLIRTARRAARSTSATTPTCRGRTAASPRPGHARAVPGLSRSRLHRGPRQAEHQWEEAKTYLGAVRPSAVVGTDEAGRGRRARRHGLHRGLSPHQVPARRRCRPT